MAAVTETKRHCDDRWRAWRKSYCECVFFKLWEDCTWPRGPRYSVK